MHLQRFQESSYFKSNFPFPQYYSKDNGKHFVLQIKLECWREQINCVKHLSLWKRYLLLLLLIRKGKVSARPNKRHCSVSEQCFFYTLLKNLKSKKFHIRKTKNLPTDVDNTTQTFFPKLIFCFPTKYIYFFN